MTLTIILAFTVMLVGYSLSRGQTQGLRFISPSFLTGAFVLLYCAIGTALYWRDGYIFLGIDASENLYRTYQLLNVFIISFVVVEVIYAYNLYSKSCRLQVLAAVSLSAPVDLIVFIILLTGLSSLVFDWNVFQNGLYNLLFDILIPIIAYGILTKRQGYLLAIICFCSISAFVGFRYRIFLIVLPLLFYSASCAHLSWRRVARLLVITAALFSFAALVGFTRVYNQGLALGNLASSNFTEVIVTGIFNDTSTVLATGIFLESFEEKNNFAGIKQLWYVLNYMLPSGIFESKSYSPILDYVYTAVNNDSAGAAVLSVAEYYHTAGYAGVVLFGLSLSIFTNHCYRRAILFPSVYNLFCYSMIIALVINTYTRGYLPQNFFDLIAMLIGLAIIRLFKLPFPSGRGIYTPTSV